MESLIARRAPLAVTPIGTITGGDSLAAGAQTRIWHVVALLGAVGAAWAAFSWALLAQHRSYHSNAFDLGFFDQIVWNTAHGRWFETSFLPYSFLGQHMEPVLLAYAALYRLRPDVEVLLLTQATVAAWAAVPLFLAARRVLASATAALIVAAAYLLSPHLHGAVLFDFHPEVLAAAAVFGAFALIVADRPGRSVAVLAAVLLLKEDAALAALGFAWIIWLRGYRRWALGLAAAALVYLLLVAGLFMPALRGGPGDLQERYGYLGDDVPAVAVGAARRPHLVLRHLLAPSQLGAVASVLATEALLPLATPAGLAAAPLLAASLLSTHPQQHDLALHYPALALDLLFVAAVLGAAALAGSQFWRRFNRRAHPSPPHLAVALAAVLLCAQAAGWYSRSPLGPVRFDPERYRATAHTAAIDRVLALVPPGAPVSAQSGLLPHLSQRRDIWEFPRLESAQFVVVDPTSWRSSQSTAAGYDDALRDLLSLGFCLLRADDGVMLFARGSPCASP